MINGTMTHYQWKFANSEQTISPEIIIRSIRKDNFHIKVNWNLQRIEDNIEHSSCSLLELNGCGIFYFRIFCGIKRKKLKILDRRKGSVSLASVAIIFFFLASVFTFWPQTAFFGQTASLFGHLGRSVFRMSLRVSASWFWRTVLCFSAAITHWHARDQSRNQVFNLGLTGRRVSPEIRACHQSRDRFSFKIRPASRFVANKQHIK